MINGYCIKKIANKIHYAIRWMAGLKKLMKGVTSYEILWRAACML